MTKDEILALSGEVVAALWQDWWSLEHTVFCDKCCWGDRCDEPRHFYRPNCPKCLGKGKYPVPPPDLTEPVHFLRALKLNQFSIGFNGKEWWSGDGRSRGCADTPELALLLALVDYVRRGKA